MSKHLLFVQVTLCLVLKHLQALLRALILDRNVACQSTVAALDGLLFIGEEPKLFEVKVICLAALCVLGNL